MYPVRFAGRLKGGNIMKTCLNYPGLVLGLLIIGSILVGTVSGIDPGGAPSKLIGTWDVRSVGTTAPSGVITSLDFDISGRPHLGYASQVGRYYDFTIWYAYRDRFGWHTEIVDPSMTAIPSPCLKVAPGGKPSVLYGYIIDVNGPILGLKLATRESSGWNIEVIEDTSPQPYQNETGGDYSLAFDQLGRPHITYQDNELHLFYAWKDSTGWHHELIDATTTRDQILQLDFLGKPSIVYTEFIPGDLSNVFVKYAWRDSSGWHTEIIGQGNLGPAGFDSDAQGKPHVVYAIINDMWTPDELVYARKDGGVWHKETVISTGKYGGQVPVVVDPFNTVHFAFFILDPYYFDTISLNHAYRDRGVWQVEMVATKEMVKGLNGGCSLAFSRLKGWGISFSSGEFEATEIRYAERTSMLRPPPLP